MKHWNEAANSYWNMPIVEEKPPGRPEREDAARAAGFAGSVISAEFANNVASATDAFHESKIEFTQVAERYVNLPSDKLKGFLFERIEAAKFNRNAARAGSSVRAQVTGSEPGGGHAAADIRLTGGGRDKLVQAKASKDPSWLARQATNEKYDEMEVLVPKDGVDEVNRNLDQAGEGRRAVGELRSGKVASGGTSTGELDWATANPKLYRLAVEAKQIGMEAAETGARAAAGGAVIGASLSTITNVHSYLTGKTDARTAVGNIAEDTVVSGARAGGTGALGAVIRNVGKRAGIDTLAKSNLATAVASGLIEVGGTVYAFAKGEITAEEAAERIGETGCATASGIYVGAAAGVIFGPQGALVGSVAGYLVMSWVYQSSLAVLQRARLAEEEEARVVALCAEATRAMERQREAFEAHLEEWLGRRENAFGRCLARIDEALVDGETDDAVTELARLSAMAGKALQFKDFSDFDEFMTRSRDPLVI